MPHIRDVISTEMLNAAPRPVTCLMLLSSVVRCTGSVGLQQDRLFSAGSARPDALAGVGAPDARHRAFIFVACYCARHQEGAGPHDADLAQPAARARQRALQPCACMEATQASRALLQVPAMQEGRERV